LSCKHLFLPSIQAKLLTSSHLKIIRGKETCVIYESVILHHSGDLVVSVLVRDSRDFDGNRHHISYNKIVIECVNALTSNHLKT
jgi:hypothetical protein